MTENRPEEHKDQTKNTTYLGWIQISRMIRTSESPDQTSDQSTQLDQEEEAKKKVEETGRNEREKRLRENFGCLRRQTSQPYIEFFNTAHMNSN